MFFSPHCSYFIKTLFVQVKINMFCQPEFVNILTFVKFFGFPGMAIQHCASLEYCIFFFYSVLYCFIYSCCNQYKQFIYFPLFSSNPQIHLNIYFPFSKVKNIYNIYIYICISQLIKAKAFDIFGKNKTHQQSTDHY